MKRPCFEPQAQCGLPPRRKGRLRREGRQFGQQRRREGRLGSRAGEKVDYCAVCCTNKALRREGRLPRRPSKCCHPPRPLVSRSAPAKIHLAENGEWPRLPGRQDFRDTPPSGARVERAMMPLSILRNQESRLTLFSWQRFVKMVHKQSCHRVR